MTLPKQRPPRFFFIERVGQRHTLIGRFDQDEEQGSEQNQHDSSGREHRRQVRPPVAFDPKPFMHGPEQDNQYHRQKQR